MNALFAVMKKELVDLSRDTRTVMISVLIGPVLFPALIAGMGVFVRNKVEGEREKQLAVAVIGSDRAPQLMAFLESQNITITEAPADPDEAIRTQANDVILRVTDEYQDQWRGSLPAHVEILHDSTRSDADIPVQRLENTLFAYSQTAGALRLYARGVSPTLSQPLRVTHRDLSTPLSQAGKGLMFLPYLLILVTFIGGANFIIDSTAGERERQSLEPLLASPVPRPIIMSGKILAAAIFNMALLMLTLAGFKLVFAVGDIGIKLDVSLWAIAGIMVTLIPMTLIFTSLLTFISAGAKSVKEAQGYLSVLMLLPMIPTMMLMINPVKNQLWMMATPLLAQNQLITRLIRGEQVSGLEWAVYLTSNLAVSAVLWVMAARRYEDEQLAISA